MAKYNIVLENTSKQVEYSGNTEHNIYLFPMLDLIAQTKKNKWRYYYLC
jgi:hypothetical protein